jgi:actin-related protein 5
VIGRQRRYSINRCIKTKLQSEGFETDADLDEVLKGLESALKRARKKDADTEENGEDPSFPLLDLPDEEVCSM